MPGADGYNKHIDVKNTQTARSSFLCRVSASRRTPLRLTSGGTTGKVFG